MPDVTLKSGRVVTVDISEMTVKEWRGFISPKSTIADENTLVMKYTGLALDEIENMPITDFKRLARAIILAVQDPLSDPN